MLTTKDFWDKYYEGLYIDNCDHLRIIFIQNDEQDMKINKVRKWFKTKTIYDSVNDYIYHNAILTNLTSKEGVPIYTLLMPFHDIAVATNDASFLEAFKNTTGGFSILIRKNKSSNSDDRAGDVDGYYVVINIDTYNWFQRNNFASINSFLLAHEVGHCLNDHPRHQLKKIKKDISKTELRMENKTCIKREVNADKSGFKAFYDELRDATLDTDFPYSFDARCLQHYVNYLYTIYGKKNLDYILEWFRLHEQDIEYLFKKKLGLHLNYKAMTSEDFARRKQFEKYFVK